MRGTWDDLNRRLVGAMLALDLHDSLVVGDKVEPERRRLFRARPTAPPRRFVQVTAAQTVLIAECACPETEEQKQTLLRQGWEEPWSAELTTYQREAPLAGAPRLAMAMVRALQELGCEVADLDVELTREEPG